MLSWTALAFAAAFSIHSSADPACVVDVAASVNALRSKGTPLRILSTDDYPPGTSLPPHHLQGVARLGSSQTILFSGSSSKGSFLYVGQMGSLPEQGRWSSNFKCKNGSCVTPEEDRLTKIMFLGDEFPHPGGIQSSGNLVAIGNDHGRNRPSRVHFFDFANPNAPVELAHLRIERKTDRAEAVGITRLASGHYLALASAGNASRITFYLSAGTDLANTDNYFYEAGKWSEGTNGVSTSDYQALQLVTQCDGQVFLLGSSGSLLFGWFDYIHVFQVDFSSGSPLLKQVLQKHMSCKTCLFRAGAGVLVDPDTAELRYYGSGYWPVKTAGGPKVLKFEEFTP